MVKNSDIQMRAFSVAHTHATVWRPMLWWSSRQS